ncbi:spirocyclase AveC family protein [Acidiferrimicrobium sp. IK]|uniref:spirocyclase AveC family protein n=1 Tax=Acidiferrimicrobium sp. IK TaxID=2871700 RepID=UPI0021CB78B3|nr:spirocyclase AveC family protein [Acidiferrimicrobium sp. IK]MCU4186860.1 spirocyclase AveC family protein [Acidiferrimicrobium sp. IK]
MHPPAVWIYNVAIPIFGSLIILAVSVDAFRKRQLTWAWLFVVCSALVWWMETIGDWGQELVYSPRLSHYHTSWLPYTTPNDPYFMPFTYAVYWTVHAVVVLALAARLARSRGWTLLRAVVVLSVPVGVVWDLTVETTSAYFGWWTYNPGFGPEIHFARGNQPLLWPMILMCIWPNLIAYVAGKPQARGLNVIERSFGLGRMIRSPRSEEVGVGEPGGSVAPGDAGTGTLVHRWAPADPATDPGYEVVGPRWRFEVARFGAWMVTFQVSFFVILCIPLVLLRLVTGHDSVYVP